MASFDFTVDTSPMAQTMRTVSGQVNKTTLAVAAMEAAVIAAEKAAAETLCDNIDHGFYSLIQSQLSTKKTENLSALRAKFQTLRELGKALTSKQERMESDVARLHREYFKIFNNIDRNLEKQIKELDQDAYRCADQRKTLITGRQLKDISEVVCYEKDAAFVAGLTPAAKLKKHAGKALETMAENISQNENYQEQMSILLEKSDSDEAAKEYIPVIYYQESSMVMQGSQVTDLILPEGIDKTTEESVRRTLAEYLGRLTAEGNSIEEKNRVAYAFRELTARSELDPRVANVMMLLFENGARR